MIECNLLRGATCASGNVENVQVWLLVLIRGMFGSIRGGYGSGLHVSQS